MFFSTRKNGALRKPYLYRQVAAGEGRKRNQYTVFLIEDNPDDREQMLRTLQQSPYIYDIHCFESGDDLVSFFVNEGYYNSPARNQHMLILIDLHLPGVDGLEILRDLKNHAMTQNVPVVIITGDTSCRQVEEAHQLQARDYVLKPLRLESIHKIIGGGDGGQTRTENSN